MKLSKEYIDKDPRFKYKGCATSSVITGKEFCFEYEAIMYYDQDYYTRYISIMFVEFSYDNVEVLIQSKGQKFNTNMSMEETDFDGFIQTEEDFETLMRFLHIGNYGGGEIELNKKNI